MRFTFKQGQRDKVISLGVKLSFYQLAAIVQELNAGTPNTANARQLMEFLEQSLNKAEEPL